MISTLTFEEIYHIWSTELWPNRVSEITSTSAMNYLGGYDISNMDFQPTFVCYKSEQGEILGVNSGHLCVNGSYRSRGLFVFPDYRGRKIGQMLLRATIDQARKELADFIWSYPKQTSWKTYESADFKLSSPWEISELGFNAYCKLEL